MGAEMETDYRADNEFRDLLVKAMHDQAIAERAEAAALRDIRIVASRRTFGRGLWLGLWCGMVAAVIVSWVWDATVGGGLVTGYAAWATELLASYAPLSYVAAGLLGTLCVATVLGVIAWFRAELALAAYLREAAKMPGKLRRSSDG